MKQRRQMPKVACLTGLMAAATIPPTGLVRRAAGASSLRVKASFANGVTE
jgi:hypothetical protein